jgi:hypothetical protein
MDAPVFDHVTVVPADTVIVAGVKAKSMIDTCAVADAPGGGTGSNGSLTGGDVVVVGGGAAVVVELACVRGVVGLVVVRSVADADPIDRVAASAVPVGHPPHRRARQLITGIRRAAWLRSPIAASPPRHLFCTRSPIASAVSAATSRVKAGGR